MLRHDEWVSLIIKLSLSSLCLSHIKINSISLFTAIHCLIYCSVADDAVGWLPIVLWLSCCNSRESITSTPSDTDSDLKYNLSKWISGGGIFLHRQ